MVFNCRIAPTVCKRLKHEAGRIFPIHSHMGMVNFFRFQKIQQKFPKTVVADAAYISHAQTQSAQANGYIEFGTGGHPFEVLYDLQWPLLFCNK